MITIPKKLDDIQKAVFKALKKQFPNVSDDELKRRSFAIARDRFKKLSKGENMDSEEIINEEKEETKVKHKLDEKGRIIIAENVPLVFMVDIGEDE